MSCWKPELKSDERILRELIFQSIFIEFETFSSNQIEDRDC